MLLRLLMELLKLFLLFIIGLVPKFPDMSFVSEWMDPLMELLRSTNRFINLPVLGGCVLTILFFYNVRFIWSIIMWVVRKIPGVS